MSYNDAYKSWHKPNTSGTKAEGGNSRTHQGYYTITNKQKYIGDPNKCIYRSGWELSFSKWCDFSPSVLKWSAEPTSVKYYDRTANLDECKKNGLDPNRPENWKIRNYNIDYWLQVDKGNNIIEKWFVEIKPKKDLVKPTPPLATSPLKVQRKFVNEAKIYLMNEAKWAAMKRHAEQYNCKFFVFTEDTLKSMCGRFFGN